MKSAIVSQMKFTSYSVYGVIDANDVNGWRWWWGTLIAMLVAGFCEHFAMVGKIFSCQLGDSTN